jgi:hypothetical protein
MKKLAIACVTLALVLVPLVAQDHHNDAEKKASDEITLSSKVKVGTIVLEPGKYTIACDRKELSFTRASDHKRFAMPCNGKDMGKKSDSTELSTSVDKDGLRVATRLLLRGSNVDHVL